MARTRNKKRSNEGPADKAEMKGRAKSTNNSRISKNEASSSPDAKSEVKDSDRGEDRVPATGLPDKGIARSGNDPEWYARDNQLVIDAASIPFSQPLGDKVNFFDPSFNVYNWGITDYFGSGTGNGEAFPGILTAKTKSSFGGSYNVRSPLNVAANMLYTHVRYMNSGRKNYDPADLMIYVGSMADVFSYLVWMERIYKKAFIYSQRNKYIGDALLKSEHIDADDIKKNLANMRYWINTFINKVASYAIPSDIYYFNRRAWIYGSIYLENPDANIKDQLYQFSPDGFYRFELDANSAGMLKYYILDEIQTLPATGYTFSDLTKIGEFLMANITGDEDFGLMAGDIIKAFDGRIIGLAPLPEESDLIPVYSEYVLEQFHNATIIGSERGANQSADHLGDVTQDSGGLLIEWEGIHDDSGGGTYSQRHEYKAATLMMNKLLTVNTPTPNPIDVMECSRMLISNNGIYLANGNRYVTFNCGADYVTSVEITWIDLNGDVQSGTPFNWGTNAENIDKITSAMLKSKCRLSLFKYAPINYLYSRTGTEGTSGGTISDVNVIGNVNNYTILHEDVIAKLHEVALLSMLSVPGVAKMINI